MHPLIEFAPLKGEMHPLINGGAPPWDFLSKYAWLYTGALYEHPAAMEKSSSQILVSCCSVRCHADKNKQSYKTTAYFLYTSAQVPNRRLRFFLHRIA